jgi:hypothetical protein
MNTLCSSVSSNDLIMDFLLSYVGKFDLYVEDQCPAYVRYCFEEPMDEHRLRVPSRRDYELLSNG